MPQGVPGKNSISPDGMKQAGKDLTMPLPQLSALIVDDVAAVRSVIAEILRQLGIAQV